MTTKHLLRKQVASELKKQRYIFYTFFLLSLVYLAVGLVFGDSGYLKFRKLDQKRAELIEEIKTMKGENEKIKAFLDTYGKNEFYTEKHAREDFGMSKKGEYIYLFEGKGPEPEK